MRRSKPHEGQAQGADRPGGRQREREPRVLVYDQTGYARLVQPEARGHERILEIAERMVEVSAGSDDVGRGSRGGGSEEAA